MKNYKKIYELLESWGKGKYELPPNNALLKEQVLAKFVPSPFVASSPRRSPFMWLSFSLSTAAVIALFINVTGNPIDVYNTTGSSVREDSASGTELGVSETLSNQDTFAANGVGMGYAQSAPSAKMVVPTMLSDGRREVPVSDTREFLKENYNATIRTRDVSDTQKRIEMMVRSVGGRVDASSAGDEWGNVSFAIPKSNLEIFRLQLKDLVGEKLYTEYLGSENLLPQKQIIEENQRQTEKSLIDAKSERAGIVKNHNQTISGYQNTVNSIQAEMTALNYEYQLATYTRKIEIENKLRELQGRVNVLQSEIALENKNYYGKITNIDSQIKYTGENLKMIQKEDEKLTETVATVDGSVSIRFIDLWELSDTYVPGPILFWILLLLAFVAYLLHRKIMRINYDY